MMDHRQIEDENWVERYVLQQLSTEQSERFEDHYLDCAECLEKLELTRQMNEGLREIVAEEGARWALGASLLGWLRSPGWRRAALGVGLSALLGTSIWLVQERTERKLLDQRLEQVLSPRLNAPVVRLAMERSASGGPSRVVQLSAEPSWMVLSVELAEVTYPKINASLSRGSEPPIWQGAGALDASGLVTVSVHSSTLEAGDHVLELEGLVANQPSVPLGQFPFRVVLP